MPSSSKTKRRACNKGRGKGVNPRQRTTRILTVLHAQRVDCARAWLALARGTGLPSSDEFIGQAVDEKVLRLMAEDPARKLPPSCDFTNAANH